jgi:hypothetical protein
MFFSCHIFDFYLTGKPPFYYRILVSLRALKLFSVSAISLVGAMVQPTIAQPSAIVEDIEVAVTNIGIMDYVEPGDIIRLQAGESLVLGYFASCVQEKIVGGTATVGLKRSVVEGGTVKRHTVSCDTGSVVLDRSQANSSGVIAFRKGINRESTAPKPQQVLFGLSPIIHSLMPGKLVIKRIGWKETVLEVTVSRGVTDLFKMDIKLVPGGLYRAEMITETGVRNLVFIVDEFAAGFYEPKLSRLIRF